MQWRVVFKMLFGKPVPAELNWADMGEWNPAIDWHWLARGIYQQQIVRFPIQSVTIFRGNEPIACWTHYDDAKVRSCSAIGRNISNLAGPPDRARLPVPV